MLWRLIKIGLMTLIDPRRLGLLLESGRGLKSDGDSGPKNLCFKVPGHDISRLFSFVAL